MESDRATFAHGAVKACPDRVHTLVPGMVILRTLMEALGAGEGVQGVAAVVVNTSIPVETVSALTERLNVPVVVTVCADDAVAARQIAAGANMGTSTASARATS